MTEQEERWTIKGPNPNIHSVVPPLPEGVEIEVVPASEVEKWQRLADGNERGWTACQAEVERLRRQVADTSIDAAFADQIAKLEVKNERLREALKNEIRWNIEGTGIHPDDQEEVIERHYQEALHPDEKEAEQ